MNLIMALLQKNGQFMKIMIIARKDILLMNGMVMNGINLKLKRAKVLFFMKVLMDKCMNGALFKEN